MVLLNFKYELDAKMPQISLRVVLLPNMCLFYAVIQVTLFSISSVDAGGKISSMLRKCVFFLRAVLLNHGFV